MTDGTPPSNEDELPDFVVAAINRDPTRRPSRIKPEAVRAQELPRETAALNGIGACRHCFWSADLTRTEDRVWCSHSVWHGWMTEAPSCRGTAFRRETRPASREDA